MFRKYYRQEGKKEYSTNLQTFSIIRKRGFLSYRFVSFGLLVKKGGGGKEDRRGIGSKTERKSVELWRGILAMAGQGRTNRIFKDEK